MLHTTHRRVDDMNRARRKRWLLKCLHGREPFKTRKHGILTGRKQLVGRRMVMQILALHCILDLDQIVALDVRVVLNGFPENSQQIHLAIQRSSEHGGQDGQDSDVQEAPHGDDDQWGLLLHDYIN